MWEVQKDEPLWRVVPPQFLTNDEGKLRVNSGAFYSDSDPEISVFQSGDAQRQRALLDHFGPGASIVAVTSSEVQLLGYGIRVEAAAEIDAPHAVLVPPPQWGKSKRRNQASNLAKKAEIVYLSEGAKRHHKVP